MPKLGPKSFKIVLISFVTLACVVFAYIYHLNLLEGAVAVALLVMLGFFAPKKNSTEFGAKANRIPDFIFDSILFSILLFFANFKNFVFWERLLLSLSIGICAALLAGVLRYLLKPRVDLWKATRKKRRTEKRNSLNNLS